MVETSAGLIYPRRLMYASLLILLKFGPEVYSISNRYVCGGCAPVCGDGRVEGRGRGGGYRLAAVRLLSFTRNLIPIPFPPPSSSLSLVVISGFIIQKWRGTEIERSTGKSIDEIRVSRHQDIFSPFVSFCCVSKEGESKEGIVRKEL